MAEETNVQINEVGKRKTIELVDANGVITGETLSFSANQKVKGSQSIENGVATIAFTTLTGRTHSASIDLNGLSEKLQQLVIFGIYQIVNTSLPGTTKETIDVVVAEKLANATDVSKRLNLRLFGGAGASEASASVKPLSPWKMALGVYTLLKRQGLSIETASESEIEKVKQELKTENGIGEIENVILENVKVTNEKRKLENENAEEVTYHGYVRNLKDVRVVREVWEKLNTSEVEGVVV